MPENVVSTNHITRYHEGEFFKLRNMLHEPSKVMPTKYNRSTSRLRYNLILELCYVQNRVLASGRLYRLNGTQSWDEQKIGFWTNGHKYRVHILPWGFAEFVETQIWDPVKLLSLYRAQRFKQIILNVTPLVTHIV
jgi:hypothetical protein